VDHSLCEGYASCNALVPEVFELDDDGLSVVIVDEVAPDLRDRVAEAIASCPKSAIRAAK